ncbi:hypothetical protein [Moorena sp. SIO3I8]|uniref:hypothetical protein n=1 Tax=Moorena sp. SIO3I8 TaxID=2607833 RepID=UPI0025D0793B|nr:hypothetical protein [Moorena sp. SIO3I8]
MPVLPRCQFYQDASSTQDEIHETGKMPVPHQQRNETGKMPVLLRCQFSDRIQNQLKTNN